MGDKKFTQLLRNDDVAWLNCNTRQKSIRAFVQRKKVLLLEKAIAMD